MIRIAVAGLFVLLLALSCYALARADVAPVSGLCYSFNGATVTTTYTGGDPYPVPVEAHVEAVEGGYLVTHRALFVRWRVWVPQVTQSE